MNKLSTKMITNEFELEIYNVSSSTRTLKKKYIFTATLYLIAPLFQSVWIYILIKHFDQVKNWATIPVIGWIMVFLFIAMACAIPYLFIIGFFLLQKIRKTVHIVSTYEENRKRKMVNMLLLVGIFADIVFGWILLTSQTADMSAIVFACAMCGGKILQANMEAIFMYHKM